MFYHFFVEYTDGRITRWNNLTRRQAIGMNSTTSKRLNDPDVVRFGWGVTE